MRDKTDAAHDALLDAMTDEEIRAAARAYLRVTAGKPDMAAEALAPAVAHGA